MTENFNLFLDSKLGTQGGNPTIKTKALLDLLIL